MREISYSNLESAKDLTKFIEIDLELIVKKVLPPQL